MKEKNQARKRVDCVKKSSVASDEQVKNMKETRRRLGDGIRKTATPICMALCVLSARFLRPVQGEVVGKCSVMSEGCSFPFTHNGVEYYTCVELLGANQNGSRHYCKTNAVKEERWSWGICDKGCLKEDGSPKEFFGELSGLESLCKSSVVSCVFPFVYKGVEYSECTDSDSDVFWCATQVEQDTNLLVDRMWAKCSEKSCAGVWSVAPASRQFANVKISPNSNPSGIEADIMLEQKSPDSALIIKGKIVGLSPGMHGFHVHQNGDLGDGCKAAGSHFNPMETKHGDLTKEAGSAHAGDFGNIFADDDGMVNVDITVRSGGASIFEDDEVSILHRALVIHDGEDDLGLGPEHSDTSTTGNAGSRLACGIVKPKPYADHGVLVIVIIVVLAIIIVGLIVFITFLVCKCVKRKRKLDYLKKDGPRDGLPEEIFSNGNRKKVPLYDELSIPFIDASPGPSPKLGRSTDR